MTKDRLQNNSKQTVLILIYIPWILSVITQLDPVLSFIIAWLGSFFIFYWTILSKVKFIPLDISLANQVMRPIVLVQLIFAGFMCCTSIFYFLDHLGYVYFDRINPMPFQVNRLTYTIAECQRLALLAHAALVTGMIVKIKQYPVIKHKLNLDLDFFLVWLCIVCYIIGVMTSKSASIIQFSFGFINISITCSALVLVRGIVNRKRGYIFFGGGLFILNFLASTLTGYKESIIINVIIIGFLLYPYFKKTILILAIPTVYIMLYILPTFVSVVRGQSWSGKNTAEVARDEALNSVFTNDTEEIDETNWSFLTTRLSEISMFTQFVEHIPKEKDYYGLEIVKNSFLAIIPRLIWPNKFNTEEISMERVYEAGITSSYSTVSAKTRPVVDGYVSAGLIGVFISMFLYGWTTQWLCNKAEEWFGGYELGCIVIFNAIFQQLWRGNNFEFLLNNMFYGFLSMYVIYWVLKTSNTISELEIYENSEEN